MPCGPKRPERAYLDILKHVTRTLVRSVSPLKIDDDVPGRESELSHPRHARSVISASSEGLYPGLR